MEKRARGLSTSFIKTVALICMFVDHFAASVVVGLLNNYMHPVMQKITLWIGATDIATTFRFMSNVYQWMRHIGRISFPVYCFFIVEGFYKTRDRKKYMRRLAACALLSEVPFDLAIYGKVIYLWHQNVFFTLLIGMLAIWAIDMLLSRKDLKQWQRILLSFVTGFGFLLVVECLFTDYSSFGVLCIILMYVVRRVTETKIKFWAPMVFVAGTAVLCILSFSEVWALLALPMIFFYQGKKGWNAKWFFYLFYPVHLALLAVAVLCLGVQTWGII